MDKFQKFDENIDIFPDVSIEPIEELMEAEKEEDFEEPAPMVVRKQEEIFPSLSNKKEEKAPVIVQDEPTVIEGDVPDKMEVVVPKRKGRGKAKKPYNAKPRTAKQLAVLEKARLARKAKREKEEKEKQNIKLDIKPVATPTPPPTPEPKPQPKPQPKTEVKPEQKIPKSIPKSINDFDTFCAYMDKYNQQRNQRNQQKNIHPNKMVNKNLLPRPPLIPNQKNQVEKIKKTVPVIEKPKNIYDPNYALNMLTNRRNTNAYRKNPFDIR
jgi:hypothetical protein